jgi:hypothetical protein
MSDLKWNFEVRARRLDGGQYVPEVWLWRQDRLGLQESRMTIAGTFSSEEEAISNGRAQYERMGRTASEDPPSEAV